MFTPTKSTGEMVEWPIAKDNGELAAFWRVQCLGLFSFLNIVRPLPLCYLLSFSLTLSRLDNSHQQGERKGFVYPRGRVAVLELCLD